MTVGTQDPQSIWTRLEELPDAELAKLSEAAISVLWDHGGDPSLPAPTQLPPSVLAGELDAEVGDRPVADALTSDPTVSRQACLVMLSRLAAFPDVAAEIEDAYRARQDLMIIDAGLLLAGALLLTVFKLKHLKIGKDGAEVDFYEAKSDVLEAIRRLLGA